MFTQKTASTIGVTTTGGPKPGAITKSSSLDNVQMRPVKSILKKSNLNPTNHHLLSPESSFITHHQSTSALPEIASDGSNWNTKGSSADITDSARNSPPPMPKKLGSTRSISFKMDDAPVVIETHSKTVYNRKPDSNITVKKLTPKLKMEIREELNEYKRTEMEVHELSASNTAFH